MEGKEKKIFVACSGGVDSSTSAALLKEEGYGVTAVFIKVWTPPFLECDWKAEREDAMRVAVRLEIPFRTYDFSDEYKKEVVDYMIEEYRVGRTPNPDVMCNKRIKFGAFFDKAMSEGADYIATGHYARLRREFPISNFQFPNRSFGLITSVDDAKDQTYFLWGLKPPVLRKTIFPVGKYKKKEVRELARKFDLPVADKKDSQGVCFLGKLDMREFLKHFIDEKKGDVLNASGEKIGTHEGAMFYTLGQRHGFEITKKGTEDPPLYVVSKDIETNTITVSADKGESKALICINIESINMLREIEEGKKYKARFRYRQPLMSIKVESLLSDKAQIIFEKPQVSVTSGQSLVLYDDDECLGGGIIL